MPSRKTKICPYCREEIDNLALKCVHCGERVGQPLGVERLLTEDDIGRPSEEKVKLNRSVVSAYKNMQGSSFDAPTSTRNDSQPPAFSQTKVRLRSMKNAAVAIGALILLAWLVNSMIHGIMAAGNRQRIAESADKYEQASVVAGTGDHTSALKLANEALDIDAENKEAAELVEQIKDQLSRKINDMIKNGNIESALALADKAIAADATHQHFSALRAEAYAEQRRYQITLKVLLEDRAMFVKPDGSQITLKIDESMSDLGLRLVGVDMSRRRAYLLDTRRDRDIEIAVKGRPQVTARQ